MSARWLLAYTDERNEVLEIILKLPEVWPESHFRAAAQSQLVAGRKSAAKGASGWPHRDISS